MPPKKAAGGAGAKKGPSYASTMKALYLKHYAEQCTRYGPRTVILLQVGGFFEMYDVLDVETGEWAANVQPIAELCGSAVQPKPTTDPGKQTFFWGFPEASLEKYEPMITAAGYSVVVVTQKKDATGEVSERSIDHVSSPGMYAGTLNASAVRREEQILLAVYVEPWTNSRNGQQHWYLASSAFDVTTGKSVTMETDITLIDGKPVLDVVTPFWSVYPPAEVCFYWSPGKKATVAAAAGGAGAVVADERPPSESQVNAMFAGAAIGRSPLIHIYTLDPKKENSIVEDRIRSEFLTEIFHHDSALTVEEHLGITHYPFARRSLFHLFQFVKDHNPSFLSMLHEHSIWTPEDNVLLGNSALEQLGMLPLSQDREQESLIAWLQKATTAMGRRTLRERILKPIADIEILEERQERIAFLRENTELRGRIESVLRGANDLARIHRRFQLGNGNTDDLLQLLVTYEKAKKLIQITSGTMMETDSELPTWVDELLNLFDIDRIRKSKEQVSDSIAVGSFHPWKRGIHTELDGIEDAWAAVELEMMNARKKMETTLGESDVIRWELKDDIPFTFLTTARRAAVLSASSKKNELTSIKRGSSGQVQLDGPMFSKANEKAIVIRANWKAHIYETWRTEWAAWIETGIDSGMLEALVAWMGMLDTDCTLARLADTYGYVRPSYIETTTDIPAYLSITNLRHPIIERVNPGVAYIAHNIHIGQTVGSSDADEANEAYAKNGVLLYGVNAAGKSSLGKAIGLAVLMAQTGMPVSASCMKLVPYTGIFTRILGNDNLWAGMSSFVVEMTEFRSILRSAGPRTLVIGDELCAGTETASATSIVAAGVKTLADRGCHFFFATHLHELVDLPEIYERPEIKSYHLTVRPSSTKSGSLIYDRKLRPGTGSPMYGLEVCRGLDMDAAFLTAAFDIRKRHFAADGSPRTSRYNASVVVRSCEVCGSHEDLETHHIVHQAAAASLAAGRHKNDKSNLAVLCEECHQAHHRGLLEIQGWVETTSGRVLEYEWLRT